MKKLKEIEEMKKSEAYPELTLDFGASEQMFWKNVLEEMLWTKNEEERLTFLLKNKLWEQAISENKLSEEDMKTYNDNQYFLNQRERDKWYELEKDQKGWTFLNKLGQQSVNYNKVEMNKLKMYLEYLSKRSVSEANINQMAKNLLITSQGYSPIYIQIRIYQLILMIQLKRKNLK